MQQLTTTSRCSAPKSPISTIITTTSAEMENQREIEKKKEPKLLPKFPKNSPCSCRCLPVPCKLPAPSSIASVVPSPSPLLTAKSPALAALQIKHRCCRSILCHRRKLLQEKEEAAGCCVGQRKKKRNGREKNELRKKNCSKGKNTGQQKEE
jgi:hypothetical protein